VATCIELNDATTENNELGDVQLLSSKMQQQKQQIDWRRNKVLELSSQGYNQSEIAGILKVDKSIVSRDISNLRLQAQQNLQKHIQNKLPENTSAVLQE
jgi:transcriptional regulator